MTIYRRKKIEILKVQNIELLQQINYAQKQYDGINEKLKQRNQAIEDQNNLTDKLKSINLFYSIDLEKDISHTNNELEHYKKLIDNLKNKIDFKVNLEK